MLPGSEQFIQTARVWRQRIGGTIDEARPLPLLAFDGMHRVFPAMPRYVAHPKAIAAAIGVRTRASVRPDPPQAALSLSAEQVTEAVARLTALADAADPFESDHERTSP